MEDVKKLEKKKKRFAARLKSSKGIICTDVPGLNIILCNVGQATGFEKTDLLKMLQSLPSISLSKFIAEKGETYSYVVFDNIENAKRFCELYDGKSVKDTKYIYMSYVESVPNNETMCTAQTPEGLYLIENFINEEEENMFLKIFDWADDSNLKNRQVKHYGYEFRYGSNDVDLDNPLSEKIPQECQLLWNRLEKHGININVPDQLTVNKYSPGQGIPSHVDRHSPFGDTILSLSLGSAVVMDWKHHSGKYIPLIVPPRSLLIMQGEARYDWQHGIQPRTWDPVIKHRISDNTTVRVITDDTEPRGPRVSLTFRCTQQGPCQCGYNTLCDSGNSKDIDGELASHLEELHVHQVYEQIAGHFSSTRHTPWPKVMQFMQDAAVGDIVLDLGAGNGKNILKRGDIVQVACERSWGLALECARVAETVRAAQCVRLDVLRAPLRDRCADTVLCVAVVHHLCTQERRQQAVKTIARLLRSGGRALITVWAKDQTKSNYLCKTKEAREPNSYSTIGGLNLPVHENRTQFQHNDLLVPWKLRKMREKKLENNSETTLLRYYHVFEEGELEKLCELPDLVIEESFFEEGNWCVICRKV